MTLTNVQWAGLTAASLAGLALLTAIAAEHWGGVVPCALCLLERWPYRITILLGALSLASPRSARLLVGLAALAMLGSAVLATVHVGVEQDWWPSPLPECAGRTLGGGSVAERLARMPARPAKPCDEPTYLIPSVPISMATFNLALSLNLGVGMAAAVLRGRIAPMMTVR